MKVSKYKVSGLSFVMMMLASQLVMAASEDTTAKITQVKGDAMFNDETKFIKAKAGINLKPGTKILTTKDAELTLRFQNGCTKVVPANTEFVVGTAAECLAGIFNEQAYNAQAIGEASVVGGGVGTPVVVWTAALTGAVVLVDDNNGKSKKAASPQ